MQHNKGISICKGMGISLMVVGHSPCPAFLGDWIYSFHMPLFFFISGYLFKEKYLETPKKFFINKFKGYYFPFVKWGLIFMLFHNIFAFFDLYGFSYSLKDFLSKTFYIVTLNGSEQLLGGYWFLIEALFSSIIAFSLLLIGYKILKDQKWNSYRIWISSCLIIVFILAACLLGENKILVKIKSVTLLATVFFLMGYLVEKLNIKFQLWLSLSILSLSLFLTFFIDHRVAMQSHDLDVLILTGMSILTILPMLNVCEKFGESKLGKMMDFIGCNTLMILTFHFLSFKLVSLGIILRDDLDIEKLASFPCINSGNNYDWILYSIVGIFLPLGCVYLTKQIKKSKFIQSLKLSKSTI